MMYRPAVFAACLLVLSLAPAAYAQPAPPPNEPPADAQPDEVQPPPTRGQLVEQLADPDYAVRASATTGLMLDETLDEPTLRQLLLDNDHPERRRRLLLIAEHHLMRAICEEVADQAPDPVNTPDTGSVGFSYNPLLPEHNPHTDHAAVVILTTLPGFPGYALLRPGDLILAIDGASTRSSNAQSIQRWLGGAIARHRPRDTVTLTIYRNEQTLDLEVTCGSLKALNEVYVTTGAGTVRRPNYQARLDAAMARLTEGLPAPEPLVPAEE